MSKLTTVQVIGEFLASQNLSEAQQKLGFDLKVDASGENFIYVSPVGTPEQNGVKLLEAVNDAKTKTPNGQAQSSNNRFWVILGAGIYQLNQQSIDLSNSFVCLAGLMGERTSVIKSSVDSDFSGTVVIGGNSQLFNLTIENDLGDVVRIVGNSADPNEVLLRSDFFIKNVDLKIFGLGQTITVGGQGSDENVFLIGEEGAIFQNINSIRIDGFASFMGYVEIQSDVIVFENIFAGNESFGFFKNITGVFKNCKAGVFSFGFIGSASGTFENCTAGDFSFGSHSVCSGTFINCTAGSNSFGFIGSASGTFINCTAGDSSFASSGIASGTFENCTAGDFSFASYGITSGTFENCTAGSNSFGLFGQLTGFIKNCKTADNRFGELASVNTARIEECKVLVSENSADCFYFKCCIGAEDSNGNDLLGHFELCVFDCDMGYLSTISAPQNAIDIGRAAGSTNLFVKTNGVLNINYGDTSNFAKKHPRHCSFSSLNDFY